MSVIPQNAAILTSRSGISSSRASWPKIVRPLGDLRPSSRLRVAAVPWVGEATFLLSGSASVDADDLAGVRLDQHLLSVQDDEGVLLVLRNLDHMDGWGQHGAHDDIALERDARRRLFGDPGL